MCHDIVIVSTEIRFTPLSAQILVTFGTSLMFYLEFVF